ncbi:glutamate-1-semialdehyde 2 1-aminomutase [Biomphalaria pfeifferi]|uniref:glutamate-1-semialdehyde 2,1-aminomutase n=1 Tax=Biomphalaria pfeifferi TaxID=112525 RepID=A0AAD8AMK6_BIOPF|nr:glutamate-1-semialdehyde 2 1-aminomutase [Biomphalaria pfeifferi]
MNTTKSSKLFAEAQLHMPGGVNSPVRAFNSVGRDPLYIASAAGAKMRDADGNEFIDYIGSWGPMIVGHAHPRVIRAIQEAAESGTSFGASNEKEIALAKLIKKFVPSVEIVRMVNSGTEATMSAMRLARGFTGRDKIIKFEGCYHGHGDSFLIKAGSGVATLGLPDSPGVTKSTAADTLTARYNDIESVYELVESNKGAVAAIFIEPVGGNMGCVPARKEFLQALRDLCDAEKILLIFDEVMTGFRLAKGGAQELYGIAPDLTTFGKIIGGGLPVGAYGGRAEIMKMIAPSGPVYQAGTLSGNPLAMTAGLETLKIIEETNDFYAKLEEKSAYLENGMKDLLKKANLNYTINRVGSMFTLFLWMRTWLILIRQKLRIRRNLQIISIRCSNRAFICRRRSLRRVLFRIAHSEEDLDATLAAFEKSL